MREIIWVSATIIVALLLFRGMRSPSLPAPPDDPWFTTNVVQPSEQRPVIVKFGAEWCGPCRMMESQLDQVDQQLGGKVRVVRIDVDEHPELSDHFHISGIPDTMVFHQGQAVGRQVGYLNAEALRSWVGRWTD